MHKIVGYDRKGRRKEYETWLGRHPEIKIGKGGLLAYTCTELIKGDPPGYVEPIPELETSYAYELVYSELYEALPDCNHGGLCW